VQCSTANLLSSIQTGARTSKHLLFRRERPYFYAFDLLMLNGRDLRGLPLIERKRRLEAIMPAANGRVMFLDSIAERGRDLFREAGG
jgi:ATP-dependent DNA ligase